MEVVDSGLSLHGFLNTDCRPRGRQAQLRVSYSRRAIVIQGYDGAYPEPPAVVHLVKIEFLAELVVARNDHHCS